MNLAGRIWIIFIPKGRIGVGVELQFEIRQESPTLKAPLQKTSTLSSTQPNFLFGKLRLGELRSKSRQSL
jgi:hypothetical protein